MRQCWYNVTFMCKVNFEEKILILVLPLRNFHLLHYPGILQWLQHLIIQFPLYYLLVVTYGRLKTKENFKLLAPKVVAVAHKSWSLTRGFHCIDLAEKLLAFCWGEVVAIGDSTVCVEMENFKKNKNVFTKLGVQDIKG